MSKRAQRFNVRKQKPSKNDFRDISNTEHVPKNMYKREHLNPQDAFDEYMEASQEMQGDEY